VSSNRRTKSLPNFLVIRGTCLGHEAYRGFGSLRDLARISKADVFDQESNPTGTQRNLSVQHARKAYQYVTERDHAFYPEMILNVRDPSYIKFRESKPEEHDSSQDEPEERFGTLSFVKDPNQAKAVVVSRLDGNHRLWFAEGDGKKLEPVERSASFCFVTLQDLNAELELFRDINDNQMGMNTSHLQNITARLLGDKALKVQNPALYIVRRLQADRTSPLHKKIHEGGKVRKGATITGLTVANLTNAIRDMLSRSAKLSQFPDAEAQYKIIKNYWAAVRKWLPEAWKRPRDFMIFKGVGLYAISYVGIEVIDRSLLKSKFSSREMLEYLKQLPSDQLAVSETLAYAGRGGGRKLANDLLQNLEEEGQMSLAKLQSLILKEE
jgi:DGQHR domain-containing protein